MSPIEDYGTERCPKSWVPTIYGRVTYIIQELYNNTRVEYSQETLQLLDDVQLSERLPSLNSHGGPIQDTPETPQTSQHYGIVRIEGLKPWG